MDEGKFEEIAAGQLTGLKTTERENVGKAEEDQRFVKDEDKYFSFNNFGTVHKLDERDFEEIYTERSNDKREDQNHLYASFESRETVKDSKARLRKPKRQKKAGKKKRDQTLSKEKKPQKKSKRKRLSSKKRKLKPKKSFNVLEEEAHLLETMKSQTKEKNLKQRSESDVYKRLLTSSPKREQRKQQNLEVRLRNSLHLQKRSSKLIGISRSSSRVLEQKRLNIEEGLKRKQQLREKSQRERKKLKSSIRRLSQKVNRIQKQRKSVSSNLFNHNQDWNNSRVLERKIDRPDIQSISQKKLPKMKKPEVPKFARLRRKYPMNYSGRVLNAPSNSLESKKQSLTPVSSRVRVKKIPEEVYLSTPKPKPGVPTLKQLGLARAKPKSSSKKPKSILNDSKSTIKTKIEKQATSNVRSVSKFDDSLCSQAIDVKNVPLRADESLNMPESIKFKHFGSINPKKSRFSNKMSISQPEKLKVSSLLQPLSEMDVLSPYAMLTIKDAQQSEIIERVATYSELTLIRELTAKCPNNQKLQKVHQALIEAQQNSRSKIQTDLNSSRILKKMKSIEFDNVKVRKESMNLINTSIYSRQNSSKSLMNTNGESIRNSMILQNGTMNKSKIQSGVNITPPNEASSKSKPIIKDPPLGGSSIIVTKLQENESSPRPQSKVNSVKIDSFAFESETEFDPNEMLSSKASILKSHRQSHRSTLRYTQLSTPKTTSYLGFSEGSFDPNEMDSVV